MSFLKFKTVVGFSLALWMAGLGAGPEEPGRLASFPGEDREHRQILAGILDSVRVQVPQAKALFELLDENGSIVLLKLSANTYGFADAKRTLGGYSLSILRPEKRRYMKMGPDIRVITGIFKYEVFSPELNQLTPMAWTWSVDEEKLDIEDDRHLVFEMEFPGKKGRPGKKVSIAVDWKLERADAVKVEPLEKQR